MHTQYFTRHRVRNIAMHILLFIFLIISNGDGARILGLFPHTGRSHFKFFEPLLKTLAERGHEVTVASYFPHENPPSNYKDVSFKGIAEVGLETFNVESVENESFHHRIPFIGDVLKQVNILHLFGDLAVDLCEKTISWQPLVDSLKKSYDLVIVESFTSDCMLGLLHVFGIKAPIIGLSSCNLLSWTLPRLGLVDNPSYLPDVTTSLATKMTLIERIQNTVMNIYTNTWFQYSVQQKEQKIIENHYKTHVPLYELSMNMSLIMVNTFYALNGVRNYVPGLVEVGGIHLNKTGNGIPKYMEKFLNESEHGVVLFSFGSLIKTATIPKYKEEIITRALSKLKQRVIWKYENSAEEGTLTGNILRVRWLPQYELLRHKKVVAFLAHGGLLGMTEAVSAGKPMVVVPFFGDQPSNGAAAEAAGLAKVVTYYDLTEESLSAALEKVLSAEMRLQARLLSNIWNDRQTPPLETAVYWVERVIRWGPAAKLHSPARDMPLYQLALLDVAAAFIAFIITIVVIIWFIFTRISRLFVKERKQKIH
ncbi:UDP-glycosyltransferase UGT5 isoform X1 [Pieris rapae]|uniref:UDP-glycosyltransferase UGT5 isoform X1 n=1 Tax=Pieris rapae TaxID=64459 RepID=UPI001E27D8A2|nr:UDP-glycosyltransferase UGT5 isoform X1 [Pieris rapae]